jgi:hypothetical protein
MSVMINKNGILIRINPKDNKKLEKSTNNGVSWMTLFSGTSSVGEIQDLTDIGKEILATTSKGLFRSTNNGISWMKR